MGRNYVAAIERDGRCRKVAVSRGWRSVCFAVSILYSCYSAQLPCATFKSCLFMAKKSFRDGMVCTLHAARNVKMFPPIRFSSRFIRFSCHTGMVEGDLYLLPHI